MAVGELTIGIPGVGAADFAATPIPSIAINRVPSNAGTLRRGMLNFVTLNGRSAAGTPQIGGPSYDPTFIWPITCLLTESEARQLGALALWQNREYQAGNDGALRLIDETEYLDSEPSPHSRTLLTTLTESWNASYEYGYGVFKVKLALPQDWRSQIGVWSDGSGARLLTFVIEEV